MSLIIVVWTISNYKKDNLQNTFIDDNLVTFDRVPEYLKYLNIEF